MRFYSLIGFPRSGTTLIARNLSCHKDIAYWEEPKYIWKYSTRPYRDDKITTLPSKRIREYVKNRFENFARGKEIFLEKTPSNIFRLGYMMDLFPDIGFIFIFRDPVDVVKSYSKKRDGKVDWKVLIRRLQNKDFPLRDIHLILWHLIGQIFPWTRKSSWGVVRKIPVDLSHDNYALYVWIQSAEEIIANYREEVDFIVSYENYVKDIPKVTQEMFDYMKLSYAKDDLSLKDKRPVRHKFSIVENLDKDLLQRATNLYGQLNNLGNK